MNQILEAVQTTFELQQEVNSALGELSVRRKHATSRRVVANRLASSFAYSPAAQRHLGFGNTTGYNHAVSVNVNSDLVDELADDNAGAWDDGVLTADEMGDDPEAAALLQALRESIAEQLGIPVEDVILTDLTDDTGAIGRRRQLGETARTTKAFGFCEDGRCSLSL